MLARSRRFKPACGAALRAVEGTPATAGQGRVMRRPIEGPRLPQPGPARSRTSTARSATPQAGLNRRELGQHYNKKISRKALLFVAGIVNTPFRLRAGRLAFRLSLDRCHALQERQSIFPAWQKASARGWGVRPVRCRCHRREKRHPSRWQGVPPVS